MSESFVLHGHVGIGPKVRGEALVARDNFSARYDLDRIRGVFSRPTHKLHGERYVGRVLVLNAAKGGVATAWMLKDMVAREMAPLALLLNYANPIMAQGAAFAGVTLIDRFEQDIAAVLRTGDEVEVDPPAGRVTVWRRGRGEDSYQRSAGCDMTNRLGREALDVVDGRGLFAALSSLRKHCPKPMRSIPDYPA